jgi:hypothetical protein
MSQATFDDTTGELADVIALKSVDFPHPTGDFDTDFTNGRNFAGRVLPVVMGASGAEVLALTLHALVERGRPRQDMAAICGFSSVVAAILRDGLERWEADLAVPG